MSTRISAAVGDHPVFLLFIYMISIDCKITNFSLYLFNKIAPSYVATCLCITLKVDLYASDSLITVNSGNGLTTNYIMMKFTTSKAIIIPASCYIILFTFLQNNSVLIF